jgi:hypothetical protein
LGKPYPDYSASAYKYPACLRNAATSASFPFFGVWLSDNQRRKVWVVCFSDTVTGPLRQLFFVVVLPVGTVVEPSVARRM